MDNLNQNYMPGQNQMPNNQPQNGGVPPVPPPPSVKVRTMESDYKSMNESGGQPPVPEKVIVPPSDPNVKFSNFNAPSQEPTFKPAPKSSSVQPSIPPTNIAKKKSPVVLIIIFLVIIALVVGAYFGYSYFFAQPSQPATAPTPFVSVPTPAPVVVPTSTPAPATTTPALIHKSFFTVSAVQTIPVSFNPADGILGLKTALVTAISSNATSGLYEAVVSDKSGNALSSSVVLPIITSSMPSSSVAVYFQPDFTLFLYKDAQGIWPGYVLALSSTSSMNLALALSAKVESAADLANFYLSDPGTFAAFKDGKLGTYSTRYAVSANKDAFNYGFFGSYLILSDSYNGMKAAVANLGL